MINSIRMTFFLCTHSSMTLCSLCSDRGMMDNGGFCNDDYHNLSSDDELVDISDVTMDFNEDVPPLDRDYSTGRVAYSRTTCCFIGCGVRFFFISFYQRT